MVALAAVARLTVAPNRALSAAQGAVGHAILWAFVHARAAARSTCNRCGMVNTVTASGWCVNCHTSQGGH